MALESYSGERNSAFEVKNPLGFCTAQQWRMRAIGSLKSLVQSPVLHKPLSHFPALTKRISDVLPIEHAAKGSERILAGLVRRR